MIKNEESEMRISLNHLNYNYVRGALLWLHRKCRRATAALTLKMS